MEILKIIIYFEQIQKLPAAEKPIFQNEDVIDIISKTKKEIVALDELIESNEKNKNKDSSAKKANTSDKKVNANMNINNMTPAIKIPKMNPLSGMSKTFNKFDVVPGNAMTGYMLSFPTPSYIEESNKEE